MLGGLIDQFSKALGKTKQLIKYLCPVSNMKRQNDEIYFFVIISKLDWEVF